jgi:hypothetical protein
VFILEPARLFAHINMAPYAGTSSHNVIEVMVAHTAQIFFGVQLCFAAGYRTPLIVSDPTGRKFNDMRSCEWYRRQTQGHILVGQESLRSS